ncbi:Putative pentatricopeptide repeat-containing protein At1g12700 [Durusdinium trenchii]|uniref:Mitochondrial n=1 Tax=Durusdinium trenchii TaxID=1381693 RepID=A0ABP0N1W4_9DINO
MAVLREYNQAIAKKRDQWLEACLLLHGLIEVELRPDVISFNSLINACGRSGEWHMAHFFLEQLGPWRLQCDVVGYSSLVTSCERGRQWRRALGLLRQSPSASLRCPVVTYNATLSALGGAAAPGALWRRAVQVLRELEGHAVRAQVISFNSVINAVHRWEHALDLLTLPPQRALRPSAVSYGSAADRCAAGSVAGGGDGSGWAWALTVLSEAREGNGSAPSMWNIQVKQMKNFEESKKYYTDVVAKCGKCTGTGKLSCEPCNGQGWSWCKDCRGEKWMWCPQCDGRAFKDTKGKGKGRPASETIDHCDHCRSTGFVSCRLCEGWGWKDCKKCHHGTVSCKKCDGYGDVVNYQQLTVQHSNIVLERKLDESGSSPTMSELREAQGSSKFFKAKVLESGEVVKEISVQRLKELVNQLLKEAQTKNKGGQLHFQQLMVKSLPACRVDAVYGNKAFQYLVYGEEMRVNAEDYPQQCCCSLQ